MAINTPGAALGAFGSYEPPENVVVVNRASQLPAAVGGVRQLAANTAYQIGADVAITDTIKLAPGVAIYAESPGITLSSSVAGPMFTGDTFGNAIIRVLQLSKPNGQVFDLQDVTTPGSSALILRDVGITSNSKFGTFNNMLALNFSSVQGLNLSDGLDLVGNFFLLEMNQVALVSASASFIGLDFGTSVFQSVNVMNSTINAPASAIGISGAASSANLTAGSLARVRDVNFVGGLTPLSGVSRSDIRWEFRDSPGVANSVKSVDAYLTAPRTVPITVIGQFETIDGANWTSDVAERFSVSTGGIVTYNGEQDVELLISATATVSKSGGGSDRVALRIAVNGTSLSKTQTVTQNNAPTSLPSHTVVTISNGDIISLQVANLDTTTDVVVDNAALDIVEGS